MANTWRDITDPTRQDTWLVTMEFEGNNTGVWDKKSGGEVDSDDTKYYPGGMGPPISLGGRKTTGNVTLQRIYDIIEDTALYAKLKDGVGKGVVKIGQTPMDKDGKPYGKKIVVTGTLKRVSLPDYDSESGTAAMIEVECIITGYPVVV